MIVATNGYDVIATISKMYIILNGVTFVELLRI